MVYGEPVETVRTMNEQGRFAQTEQHAAPEQLVSALSTTTRSPTATVETIAHVEPTNDPALPADAVPVTSQAASAEAVRRVGGANNAADTVERGAVDIVASSHSQEVPAESEGANDGKRQEGAQASMEPAVDAGGVASSVGACARLDAELDEELLLSQRALDFLAELPGTPMGTSPVGATPRSATPSLPSPLATPFTEA